MSPPRSHGFCRPIERCARLLAATFLIAPLCGAAPAIAEVVSSSDTEFIIRAEADPFGSRAALIAPAKWWNAERTWSGKSANLCIDSQATGCFCERLAVPDGAPEGTRRGSVGHLHFVATMLSKLLRLIGGLGPLQANPVSGLLTMKDGEIAPAVDKVLNEQLASLAALLGAKASEAAAVPVDQARK